MAFNRTIVELKLQTANTYKFFNQPFNRTIVELKCRNIRLQYRGSSF